MLLFTFRALGVESLRGGAILDDCVGYIVRSAQIAEKLSERPGVQRWIDFQIDLINYIYIYTHIHIYIYIFLLCVCVCVCVCGGSLWWDIYIYIYIIKKIYVYEVIYNI